MTCEKPDYKHTVNSMTKDFQNPACEDIDYRLVKKKKKTDYKHTVNSMTKDFQNLACEETDYRLVKKKNQQKTKNTQSFKYQHCHGPTLKIGQ